MSEQELPEGVNNAEEDQPKNVKGKGSSNVKNKSKSPEAGQKQSENARMQRPKSAADRKGPKFPIKFKETREMAVRREFQIGLNKITYNETREIGMNEIQNIISNNRSPQDLRVYISALCDQPRNLNSATKEMEVLIFGFIASVFKEDLFDSIDKPPNLIKSVVRLCEAVHSYFKDTSSGVQSACAKTLNEIYSNCIQQQPPDTVKIIIAEPLLSILNGGADKATQQTAAICLCEFAGLLSRLGKKEVVDEMCEKIYTIFLKTNHDFIELMRAIGICMAANNLAKISDKLPGIINKLCAIAGSNSQLNQYYLNRMEACNTLGIIGKILAKADVQVKGDLKKIYDKVSELLKDISKHKILRLQKAGASALKQWELLLRANAPNENEDNEKVLLPEEEEALRIEDELKSKQPPEKNEMPARNNFREARDQLKKDKQENQEQKIEDFIKDAQLKHNRGQNYVRARTGIGGGYVAWSPPPKDGKAAKEKAYANQKKNLKEQIIQQYLNRPKTAGDDKFSYLPEDIWPKKPASKDEVSDSEGKQVVRDKTPEKNDEIEAEDVKTVEPNIDKPIGQKKLQRPQTAVNKTQEADDKAKSREGSSAAKGKQTKKVESKSTRKASEDVETNQSENPELKSTEGVRESSNLRSKGKKNTKDEKSIVSNEDAADTKNQSDIKNQSNTNSEKQLSLKKTTKKPSTKDLSASDSSSKTPRKTQRLNDPDKIEEDHFKDVKLQTQNNKIDSGSKPNTIQNLDQGANALNSEHPAQQHKPSEHVEKIAIQTSSHREKVAAIRQPKPMIKKTVQPQQNITQQKEMTDQEIEDLLTKAESKLNLVKEKEKKEAEEALKRKNDELLKKKAQDELERKKQEYKKPPPKSFDQNPRYKLFEVDEPIEKAVAYFIESVLPSENNEIEQIAPTGGGKNVNVKPQQKDIPKNLPRKTDVVKGNNIAEVKNEQLAIGNPALFGIAMGNQNLGQNDNVPQRKLRGRAKASNSENVEPVINKPLVIEEEENHEGEKWESPARHEDFKGSIATFDREEMDHVGTQQINPTLPQRTIPNQSKVSNSQIQNSTVKALHGEDSKLNPLNSQILNNVSDIKELQKTKAESTNQQAIDQKEPIKDVKMEHVSKEPIMTKIRPPQNFDTPLEITRPDSVSQLNDKVQGQKVQDSTLKDSKQTQINPQLPSGDPQVKKGPNLQSGPINPSVQEDKLIKSQIKEEIKGEKSKPDKLSKEAVNQLLNSQQNNKGTVQTDSVKKDYVTKKPTNKVTPPPYQQTKENKPTPIKRANVWDEKPISSSKMGYSLPIEAFQNEEGLDYELADSLGTFQRAGNNQNNNSSNLSHNPADPQRENPLSNNSKKPNEAKTNVKTANVHPGNQNASLNKNIGIHSADERPLQNSRIRQGIPQEAYQNEEGLDHELADSLGTFHRTDPQRENPLPKSSKKPNEVKTSSVTTADVHPGNQNASVNKNIGIHSADERPLQNSRIKQGIPLEAYQNEDALDELLSDPQQQLDVIREDREHSIPKVSREKQSPDQNIFHMEEPHQQLPSEVFNRHVDNVIQRTGIRQPQQPSPDISVGGHVEPIHDMLGLEDIIRDQIKIQLQKMLPSKSESQDNTLSAKASRPVTKNPESKVTEKVSPILKQGEPHETSIPIDRQSATAKALDKSPERPISANSSLTKDERAEVLPTSQKVEHFAQRQQIIYNPEAIDHEVPQEKFPPISSQPGNKLSQEQSKNQMNPIKLQIQEQPLKTAGHGISQGHNQPVRSAGMEKQRIVEQAQGFIQNVVQNVYPQQRDQGEQQFDRKLKPEPLGNLINSTIDERKFSDSNWLTPTAQNMGGVLKGNEYINKNSPREIDTVGYGSTDEDEVDQRQQYPTYQAQMKSYNNHVGDRALNGNYIEQRPLPESIKYDRGKRSVEKPFERTGEHVRTSYQNPRATFQKSSEIISNSSVDKPQGTSTLEKWQMALSLIEEGKYETAYSNILESGDDVYLLRLMKVTGPCLKNLSRTTAMKLMNRLTLLMGSDFMAKIGIGFLENAQNHGLIKNLHIGHQNELMKAVRDISLKQTALGAKSSKLMLRIENDFKNI